jgi:hypothetical protein
LTCAENEIAAAWTLTIAKYDGFGDEKGIDDSTDGGVGLGKTGFA